MKRILALLVLIACVFTLPAIDLGLSVSSDNFRAYGPYGDRLDLTQPIDNLDGVIVMTNDEEVTFTTTYGEIALSANTIFSILSLNEELPEFYLVTGDALFTTYGDLELHIYTPVSLLGLYTKGSYRAISTDDEEAFVNYTEDGFALIYDATEGLTYVSDPRSYSSLLYSTFESLDKREEVTVEVETPEVVEEVVVEVPAVTETRTPAAPTIESVYRRLTAPTAPTIYVSSALIPDAPDLFYDITFDEPEIVFAEPANWGSTLLSPSVSVRVFEPEKKTNTI